jgi:hypothetical protein
VSNAQLQFTRCLNGFTMKEISRTLLRINLLIVCTVALLLASSRASLAQSQTQALSADAPATETERQFDEAASAHKVELEDLLRYRGVMSRFSDLRKMRESAPAHRWVPDVLRSYYLPGTTLLFYGFHSERLSTWLTTSEGIIAHATVPTSEDQLASAINDLRLSLGVEAIILSRSPRRRLIRRCRCRGRATN